ncbi:hypothetical protein HG530_014835 [Fusarium avenaceum]|nr:hypothetical protein HG530_014835 [Fusarium avenaceum]
MCGIANTIALIVTSKGGDAIDVLGGGTASVVHIARQSTLVEGIANEEHALDGTGGATSQLRKSIDSGSGALRVALKNDTLIGIRCYDAVDLPDNVSGSSSRVLTEISSVNSVVHISSGCLGQDPGVHCPEAS